MATGRVTFKMRQFTAMCDAPGTTQEEFEEALLNQDPGDNDLDTYMFENLEIVKVEQLELD